MTYDLLTCFPLSVEPPLRPVNFFRGGSLLLVPLAQVQQTFFRGENLFS